MAPRTLRHTAALLDDVDRSDHVGGVQGEDLGTPSLVALEPLVEAATAMESAQEPCHSHDSPVSPVCERGAEQARALLTTASLGIDEVVSRPQFPPGSANETAQTTMPTRPSGTMPRRSLVATRRRVSAVVAHRLRRRALHSESDAELDGRDRSQTSRRMRRRVAQADTPQYVPMEDDDSDEELVDCPKLSNLLCTLLTTDEKEARMIHFTAVGAHIQLDGLQRCKQQVVKVSTVVAMVLSGGVDPTSCVALRSGRVTTLSPGKDFQLRRSLGGWLLVENAEACFNFVLSRWQPVTMATHGPYAPVEVLLYLAFVPEKNVRPAGASSALFVKIGFREMVQGDNRDRDSLIGYLEKKSPQLQLTNVPGAGIFAFEVPQNHKVFARPGNAAETSLKTELLHDSEVIATPSGHCRDVGTFSASLEYFFIEEAKVGSGPLAALTQMLQRFTGNRSLLPQCVVASEGGGLRRGRKRLQPWPEAIELVHSTHALSRGPLCGYRSPLRTVNDAVACQLPSPVKALRSRAKRAQLQGDADRKLGAKCARYRPTI